MPSFLKTTTPDVALAPESVNFPLQPCEICETLIDVSEQEPLTKVACPGCGAEIVVRGEIANFELLGVAGRGGMGVVYKAHDTSLDRHVALKLLRKDHSSDAELIAKLETEAAITAAVNHPHVVKVFSSGTDHGRFYIAMELVEKGSLDDLIRLQGRVAEAQALQVGIQIAQGLRAAHEHGLIHRDVKPGNILFADANTARIVDFGLAIFMEQEESVRGEIWGTPYYVAPEKLDDKPEDFRSDIYSLGGTLFHALAGRPPFEAENASLVALKHLKSQPVSLQAFAPHVSSRTAYVINRTLNKDPHQRYQSYDELIEHLEYARNELVAAAGKHEEKRVVLEGEEEQKAWGWVTIGMIVVVLALLAGGALLWRSRSAEQAANKAAIAAAEQAESDAPAAPQTPLDAARAKLVKGDANGAAQDFAKIAAQPRIQQAEVCWAVLHEGLAELSAGRLPKAQQAFKRLADSTVKLDKSAEDQKLAHLFTGISSRMTDSAPIDPASVKVVGKNEEAIKVLLYGLKNWHVGKAKEGVDLLRQFRSLKREETAPWVASLKPLASARVDEYTALQLEADKLKLVSVEEKAQIADRLKTRTGPLAGRVKEILAPLEKDLAAYEKVRALPPRDGIYKIVSRKSGRALDVAGRSRNDGSKIQLWDAGNAANQQWVLTALPGGAYKIVGLESGKAMDLPRSSVDDGASIHQWQASASPSQKWRIESTGGGFFKILAGMSSKALTAGNGAGNGAAVSQWAFRGNDEQQWRFVPVAIAVGEWLAGDVGRCSPAGSTALDATKGVFTIKASGADIWGGEDAFHFVSQTVRGDFELVARVVGITQANEWSKAGVMLRETTAANSRNVNVVATAAKRLAYQRRPDNGAQTTNVKFENVPQPRWLKLVRKGETVTGFESADGKAWTQVGTDTLAKLAPEVAVGLAVTSHADGTLTTATIDSVKLTKAP